MSVVIPTHRRPQSLLCLIDALTEQVGVDPACLQVVVVCDGTGDPAYELLQQRWYPMQLCLAEQQQQGPGAARNQGVALATGEVIVFLDDDVVPDPRLLAVHQRAHAADPDLVGIGPLVTPADHGSPWIRWEGRTVQRQYEDLAAGRYQVTPRQFFTGNASVRRRHLIDVRGFDSSFLRGEDVELAFRLRERGLRFAFLPEATARHLAQRPYAAWIRMAESYGHVEVRMSRERGHQDLLAAALREFHMRHPLTRALARSAIGRPWVAQVAALAARPLSIVAGRLGLVRAGDAVLSAVFDTVRLQGFVSEMGGVHPALALLNGARPA